MLSEPLQKKSKNYRTSGTYMLLISNYEFHKSSTNGFGFLRIAVNRFISTEFTAQTFVFLDPTQPI